MRRSISIASTTRRLALTIMLVVGAAPFWALVGQETASTVEPARTVDRSYRPSVSEPAYPASTGPVVFIDEAHNNFHTSLGTYEPFAELLRRDGYVVRRSDQKITAQWLAGCAIYVIAGAQPPSDPGAPSTFSNAEVQALHEWVRSGGSLFLITDHMPDPGAVAELTARFGAQVNNGYVLSNPGMRSQSPILFTRADGTLADDPITRGRTSDERVEVVATFTGAAFRDVGNAFRPILILGPGRRSWMPATYWQFPPGTPSIDVAGWLQGAVRRYGGGRVAFFGEAAMFSAQILDRGQRPFGMNHPEAQDNHQLLLNVMHWLSGIL